MSDGISEARKGTFFKDRSKLPNEFGTMKVHKNSFKIGDIIIYERWSSGDKVPKIFRCIKYDEDWGVVWYNDNGRKDSIGIAYVRKANIQERIINKIKQLWHYLNLGHGD